MDLSIEPLSAAAFAPFGQVLEVSDMARHFTINAGFAERYHDLVRVDVASSGGRPQISIFRARPRSLPMALILLERHPLGSQTFMPLSQLPYLVVVAPPADASRPDLARLRCFAAGPGQGVNYAAGTWHHPLLALQAECDFLVVDRGGAASDHNCDEFALYGLGLWLAVGPNTPESFSSQGVA